MSMCNYVFTFTARRISDKDDERTILLPYFGKIKLKNRYAGIKSQKVEENELKAIDKIEKGRIRRMNKKESEKSV